MTHVESSEMWSWPHAANNGGPSVVVNSTFLRGSELLQPFKYRLIFAPRSSARAWDWLYFGNGLALHVEVDAGVAVGRIGAGMPEKLTNR